MTEKVDAFSASNYYITQFYGLAKRCGFDADALLKDAGIDSSIVDQPGVRVNAEKLSTLVQEIWDGLDDEAMSLAGSKIPRGSFEMMGKLTVHEPKLLDAIILAQRFYSMVSSAYSMQLEVVDQQALLKFQLQKPELDSQHLFTEITLMSWHRYFSWLVAENILLDKVFFHYPPPRHLEEYSYLFPGQHEFDADFFGFSFSRHFLDSDNTQSADSLKVFMKNCPADLFLQPTVDFSLTGAVNLILKRSFKPGFPTIDMLADRLHISRRTLIRRLRDEGTSYQKLKDSARRDRAVYLLSKGELSINDIAEQVGFSDAAVFARAFRSWTNMTPGAYKQLGQDS